MPSLEIICVGQEEPLDFSAMPFAVVAERRLISHRSRPLFQKDFDQLTGCIYHLGNPRLKDPNASGAYFASDLLADFEDVMVFKPEYAPFVQQLTAKLLMASPAGRLIFTSDYQFGPHPEARFQEWQTPAEFWQLHDTQQLRMNALYQLHIAGTPKS